MKFKQYLRTTLLEMTGQKVAVAGTASERHITKAINYYAGQKEKGVDHDTAMKRTSSYRSRMQPSKIHDPEHPIKKTISKLGRPEYNRIWHDSKHAAAAIINHVQTKHGEIVGAAHTGADIMHGVEKLTGGKKSSADVLLKVRKKNGEIHHVNVLGASLKYSTTSDPGSQIKIHSPSPNTFSKIVERHHEALHGKKFGIDEKIGEIHKQTEKEMGNVYTKHHDFLAHTFGINAKKETPKGSAFYRPGNKEGPVLNDNALSHVRRMKEAGDPHANAFYTDLANTNVQHKQKVANVYHQAIKNVLTGHGKVANPNHKRISNSLFRSLVNVPERRSNTHVDTLLVNTTRKVDKTGKQNKPHITVYHAGKSVRNYLDSLGNGDHHISKSDNSTTFRVGPSTVTVDTRPGSKSGSINVNLDKKALRKVGDYA